MFKNVFIMKYNKIVYILCLERELYEYEKYILNYHFELFINKQLDYKTFYNVYNVIYFDKLKYLINYSFEN